MSNEFVGVRSKLYKEALMEYPEARLDDIAVMKKYLRPKNGETILEVGAGSGFFSGALSDMVGNRGLIVVSDPSSEQLDAVKFLDKKNMKLIQVGSDELKLAKHFDEQVAKYYVTGHEVAFWSREYAQSICFLAGLEKPKFYNINQKWRFKSRKDLGIFLYKIHAMTKTTSEECLKGAERILGVKKNGDLYELTWPMQIIFTRKS